ncbi:MAG TPA: N-formylglutamate amidohydrolase [Anaerolineae bacterium]|nr:N-formylglutamate amidohydrolase [Anaerolineae bacterium]
MAKSVIIHIPHASTLIPAPERAKLLISEDDLRDELLRMTDRYTDELFDVGGDTASRLIFPVSRLVCDPERFADDAHEPMAAKGMGAVYTRTSDGHPLRSSLDAEERQRLLERYYEPHHGRLEQLAGEALETSGHCLIVDAHSFPSSPLPCDQHQSPNRPDICIGTDTFHTPERLQESAVAAFGSLGWRVELNRPYAGSIVPSSFFQKDARVHSVMVEVKRSLYMNEDTGERFAGFDEARRKIQLALGAVITDDIHAIP